MSKIKGDLMKQAKEKKKERGRRLSGTDESSCEKRGYRVILAPAVRSCDDCI